MNEKVLIPSNIKNNWKIFIQFDQDRQTHILFDALRIIVTCPQEIDKRDSIIKKVLELSSNDIYA